MKRIPQSTLLAALLAVTVMVVPIAHGGNRSVTTLRQLADARGFLVGGLYHDLHARISADHAQFSEVLSSEFNMISESYSMSMDEIWLGPDRFFFRYPDFAARFARDNGMVLRGTHLTWHETLPNWLMKGYRDGTYSKGDVQDMVHGYITRVMSRYRTMIPDVVRVWNVANEVIGPGGRTLLRDNFFLEVFGRDYVKTFFVWAREADPDAVLYINEYGALGNARDNRKKADQLLRLVKSLQADGVPVQGVGFQAHVSIDEDINWRYNKKTMQRFARLGLELQLTEVDVLINDDLGGATRAKLRQQASVYRKLFKLCLSVRQCTGVNIWGLVDKYHYINVGAAWWLEQDEDWPLLFDDDYERKRAYRSVARVLQR